MQKLKLKEPRTNKTPEVPDAWIAEIEEIKDMLSEVCPWRLETWLTLLRQGSSLELEIAYGNSWRRHMGRS